MTRDEIARDINANIKGISRQIQVDYLLEYEEGQIIDDQGQSWTDGGEFRVENPAEYTYILSCVNECPCHVVDYSNAEELYALAADDCEREKEVLVPSDTKFRVTYVAPAGDMKEMGFITVELEYISDENE